MELHPLHPARSFNPPERNPVNAAAAVVANAARTDLRLVYLHVFDEFASDPSAVADFLEAQPDHADVNVRYARELLGVLTTHRLVEETDVNLSGDIVWQVANPGTYDDHTRTEAEQVIDTFLDRHIPAQSATPTPKESKMTTTAATTTKANPADLPICGCTCGNSTSTRKSVYLPGHDARHAGNVARSIAETALIDVATNQYVPDFTALDALGSDKLKAKAAAMAERLVAKMDAKLQTPLAPPTATTPVEVPVEAEPVVEAVIGTITKGRNPKWPARKTGDLVEANSKRDSLGEWTPATTVQAATFSPAAV